MLLLPLEAVDTPDVGEVDKFVWRKSKSNSTHSSCVSPVGDETDQVCSSCGVGTDGYEVDSEYYGRTKISGAFVVIPLSNAGYYSPINGVIAGGGAGDEKLVPNVGYSWWSGHINNKHAIRGLPVSMQSNSEYDGPNWNWKNTLYGDIPSILRDKTNVPKGLEDVGCTERMFVEFRTLRAISVGEELVVDVEVDEATGFKYLGDSEFASSCL